MADASLLLLPESAIIPDGSTGNAAPQIERIQGSDANPKKHYFVARFDSGTDEFLYWRFKLPSNAAASPSFTLKIDWASVAAVTATNVVWAAFIAAVTPGDADTPIEHAEAAAQSVTDANDTVEAGRLNTCTISFTNAQADGAAPGDEIFLCIFRDADNASDSLGEDARFYGAELLYTLA